jgi:hypothetical protein
VFGSTAFFITGLPLVVLSMGHDLVMYHSTQIHKGTKIKSLPEKWLTRTVKQAYRYFFISP